MLPTYQTISKIRTVHFSSPKIFIFWLGGQIHRSKYYHVFICERSCKDLNRTVRKVRPGTSVPDPWHFGVNPIRIRGTMSLIMDPDPALFVIILQDANKKLILKKVFLLITFWRHIYIIFKDKKSKRSHKTAGINFPTILAWNYRWIRNTAWNLLKTGKLFGF